MTIEVTYNVTDIYISSEVSPIYIDVSYSANEGGASVWGSITGTLSDQTDLQTALNAKFDDPTGTTAQYLRGDGSLATFPSLTGYVPYTGATTNVNLGEYEIKAGQVTLDTSPTGTAAVGTTRWNDTIGSAETTLKGGTVVLKNGVDLVARIVNKVTPNTTLTKAAYQAVRVSGAQGQRLAVAFAQANNDNNSADTIGLVIETIATNQEGFIITVGQIEGINTTGSLQGETWADGDVLYLSPTIAGALTNVKPTGATGHIVIIGYVEYAHANNGKIYVKVMNGWELDELHNVSITSVANNQGLFYNSTSSLWENKSISTILGYTPEQPLTFSSPLSRATNAVSISAATSSVNGYLSSTDWSTFNGKQSSVILTTTGTSGASTFVGATLNIPQYQGALTLTTTGTSGAATLVGTTLNIPQYSGGGGMAIGGSITSATAGSVLFAGTSGVLAQNNANFFWDNTNNRLGIGTNAPGYRLDVNGTARVQDNLTVSKNQNLTLISNVSNTTSGNLSQAIFEAISSNGKCQFGKTSAGYSAYKTLAQNDAYLYNATSGDISILNDFSTGNIKFTAGASSTAQMTLTATGKLLLGTVSESTYILDVNAGTARMNGSSSSRSGLEVGTLNFQFFATNNAFIAENAYYNGSAFQRVNTGFASVFYFAGGGFQVGTMPTGTAGTTQASLNQRMYLTNAGTLAISDTISGGGNITLVASAVLQTDSTTKGFLPPRMTTTQKNAIASPAAGLVVYDTTLAKLCVYTTAWETITSV